MVTPQDLGCSAWKPNPHKKSHLPFLSLLLTSPICPEHDQPQTLIVLQTLQNLSTPALTIDILLLT